MNDPILGPATVGGRSSSVSLVVQHAVRPEATERYETWLSQISAKNAEYPGHQGVHIIRPGPGNRTYTVVVGFATFEGLEVDLQFCKRPRTVDHANCTTAKGRNIGERFQPVQFSQGMDNRLLIQLIGNGQVAHLKLDQFLTPVTHKPLDRLQDLALFFRLLR